MKNIKSIKNIGKVKSFEIEKKDDVHRNIISFLISLGFDEEETVETFDISFVNLHGDLLYIESEDGEDAYVVAFDNTVKIIDKTVQRSNQASHIETLATITGQEIRRNRLEAINNRLESSYEVTRKDIARGYTVEDGEQIRINPKAEEYHVKLVKSQDQLINGIDNTVFLLMGQMREDDNIQIHYTNKGDGTPKVVSLPYFTIGSGHDLARATLDEYYQEKPLQEKLNKAETLFSGLKAYVRAELGNHGVQGTASIKLIENDQILTPPHNNSVLMTHIFKGTKGNYLRKEFALETLPELLRPNTFDTVSAAVEKEVDDVDKFEKYLLGYVA